MDSNVIGLVAVIMALGIPMACLYTFYRVKKLRTDERMAALARGVNVPMEPELPTAGAVGYIATFAMIARMEPDAWIAGSFGIIPLCVGIGYFVDFALLRKDQIA